MFLDGQFNWAPVPFISVFIFQQQDAELKLSVKLSRGHDDVTDDGAEWRLCDVVMGLE